MINELSKPILSGGIKSVYFFNGRLLSGEDLSQEQIAQHQARELLGQAVGDGVAYGLEVEETQGSSRVEAPVVTVSPGLAVNRLGQPIRLPAKVDVTLVRPLQGGSSQVTALFTDCDPLQQGAYSVGKGVYVLTIQPDSGTDGKAPVSGLGNIDAACNARYRVDGVRFRLIQLSIDPSDLNDEAHLRNRLAYLCFGSNDDEVKTFFAHPFGPAASKWGILDDLRPICLTDSEVPLAALFWTHDGGLMFVDLWSVRRRITHPSADADWRVLTSDRRLAEAEARYYQFEQQIEFIRANQPGLLPSIQAGDRFKYLPPVGALPIRGGNSPVGFDRIAFFGAKGSTDIAMIDARLLPELLHESLYHEQIDLSRDEKIQLYLIYENVRAVEQLQVPQLVLVFASAALPYHGVARFNRAWWGPSRYAPHTI